MVLRKKIENKVGWAGKVGIWEELWEGGWMWSKYIMKKFTRVRVNWLKTKNAIKYMSCIFFVLASASSEKLSGSENQFQLHYHLVRSLLHNLPEFTLSVAPCPISIAFQSSNHSVLFLYAFLFSPCCKLSNFNPFTHSKIFIEDVLSADSTLSLGDSRVGHKDDLWYMGLTVSWGKHKISKYMWKYECQCMTHA